MAQASKSAHVPKDKARNAALDPLDPVELTARQLVTTFNIIRSDVLIAAYSEFPRYDDLSRARDELFFHEEDLPEAVLFISHRWQSPSHPNPDGLQFATLKMFLAATREICSAGVGPRRLVDVQGLLARLKAAIRSRLRRPGASLQNVIFTHGGYQAAYFLGAYDSFDPGSESAKLLSLGNDVLRRIGVWYDYSSISQRKEPRAVTALGRMHELIGSSNLIALRHPGDTYSSRAWCAAEVSIDPDISRTR